jgi:LemA protein
MFFITSYNGIVKLKNMVKKAWYGIDVQQKRRTNLIPNLIETVKGYAKHEKELLENVTKARTSLMHAGSDVKKAAKAENMLSSTLKSLFAVAENYPQLKANQNFLKLQEELSETEDQIAASRRIYNENVNYFNTKIESFPSNMIAGMFGFKQFDFFEADPESRKNVNVKF